MDVVRAWAERWGLVGILGLAVLVRLANLWALSELPQFSAPDGDAQIYHELARRLSGGDVLLGERALRMSPGYPYFLGLVYTLLGPGDVAFRVVQLVMGLGVVVLAWDSARLLFGRLWALLPAAVAAAYGPYLFYESCRLAASLGVLTHALLLWLALRCVTRGSASPRAWLVVGLAWGLAIVVRPNALLLAVPLAWAIWELRGCDPRARLRLAVALGIGAVLCIAPVTLRNRVATGELVVLTAHGGFNLYVGNGPGATGSYRRVPEAPADGPFDQFDVMHRVAQQEQGRRLSDAEVDAHWYGRTFEAIVDAPGPWLRLMVKKLRLFWNAREIGNVYDYEFNRRINGVLGAPLPQLSWFLGLALFGSLVSLLQPGALRFLAVFNLAACAGVIAAFVVARYRLPFVLGALLAATHGLRWLLDAARQGRRRHVAVAVPLLLAALLAAHPVGAADRLGEEYFKLATGYHDQRRPVEAEQAYLQALRHDPQDLRALNNLAVLYETAGAAAPARATWQRLLEVARIRGDDGLRRRATRHLERLRPR